MKIESNQYVVVTATIRAVIQNLFFEDFVRRFSSLREFPSPWRLNYSSSAFYFVVPNPLEGGGAIYSNGFFFVQSILADRYIHRRELRLYH